MWHTQHTYHQACVMLIVYSCGKFKMESQSNKNQQLIDFFSQFPMNGKHVSYDDTLESGFLCNFLIVSLPCRDIYWSFLLKWKSGIKIKNNLFLKGNMITDVENITLLGLHVFYLSMQTWVSLSTLSRSLVFRLRL